MTRPPVFFKSAALLASACLLVFTAAVGTARPAIAATASTPASKDAPYDVGAAADEIHAGAPPAEEGASGSEDSALASAVEPIDSKGWLDMPANGPISRGFQGIHEGVDIVLPLNSAVRAADDGVVLRAGWDSDGYGYMVWIDHGDGLRTLYAHLNRIAVKPGQVIKRGQLVGLSGNTGWSLGPHLHFEISVRGHKQNPAFFMRKLAPNAGRSV